MVDEVNYQALDASKLPQYCYSGEFMERFMEAIHFEDQPVSRSPNSRGVKIIDGSEIRADAFDFFFLNLEQVRERYFYDLSERLADEEKAEQFCEVISKEWFDGKKKRHSSLMDGMRCAIRDYMSMIAPRADMSQAVHNHIPASGDEWLDSWDIARILTLNKEWMYSIIHAWLDQHPSSDRMGIDDVFFRRGLCLDKVPRTGDYFVEWDYLNSYSIALSAPEKFSQMVADKKPVIVNAEYNYFDSRVLFFSPLVKGMDVGQLEVGVIPKESPDQLMYQGEHGGIHEVLLGCGSSVHGLFSEVGD